MEGSTNNCRGDGCTCRVKREGGYCSEKCTASNDYGHCHCGHSACTTSSKEVHAAAHAASAGDEKVS